VKSIIRMAIDAFAAVRERSARARLIEQLDEHTLRDIGLESEANRARMKSRQLHMRFGMY
jgi:hypothetical protein